MTKSTAPAALPRRAKWPRRFAATLAVYLLCWSVTWAFAPAALNRWWATQHSPTGIAMAGNAGPVEFRTGVPFKGQGFEYGPDFTPQGKWWCCVGRPWCPAPFVVASEVAWVNAPLSGYAGTMYFGRRSGWCESTSGVCGSHKLFPASWQRTSTARAKSS